jgi:hypothetical protein
VQTIVKAHVLPQNGGVPNIQEAHHHGVLTIAAVALLAMTSFCNMRAALYSSNKFHQT